MTVSLDALVQAFRLPKAKRSGSREEKARQLSCNAMYAMHHPHLCDDMPHRFFPVRADDALCIRCGALERWP